ncbi:tripartite motif-containing protein 72-like [Gopherus evgoodei]|uniref:tripartite motif-containing protein 72-like n=1 Tax=Gopherus evgoodei TaxID=1825980 RepID=UPI0011CF5F4F|nr:tripartite motif-containing protein 72-like [Gopherus evgoodei]
MWKNLPRRNFPEPNRSWAQPGVAGQGNRQQEQSRGKEVLSLDPDMAHPNLVISKDGKEVTCVSQERFVDSSPRRFDMTNCVVAKQSFSTGQHYWEVSVGWKRRWNLGVVSDRARRQGRLISMKRWPWPPRKVCTEGYWLIGYHQQKAGKKYWIFDTNPWSLDIHPHPETIGVHLNYTDGVVSFYNADHPNTLTHIHTFHTSFDNTPVYPIFDPCWHDKGGNTQSLKTL